MKLFNDIKKQTCLFFCLSLWYCHATAAPSLRASVDRQTLAENESLNLVITLDGHSNDQIDTRQLSHQFEILNQQRSSRQSIINGQVSASTQWSYSLLPKEAGALVIPSFEYRGSYSDAIPITVHKQTHQQATAGNRDVFLQASVDKQQVYVQQQVLLTLRLYYNIDLDNYEAEPLALADSLLTPLKEHSFRTRYQGEDYQVLELLYAIHPQASGTLQIPAQRWRLRKTARNLFGSRSNNQFIIVNSEAITIEVDPTPAHYQGKHWLPATEVTLEGQWLNSIIQARVGEPVNYQLRLSAQGLQGSQLPEIKLPDNEHISLYQEPSRSEDAQSEHGIVGTRTHNFALIPQKPGTLELPEITLHWWNTETQQQALIRLGPQTLVVAPSQLNDPLSHPRAADASTPASNGGAVAQTDTLTADNRHYVLVWQLISAVLALLCAGLGLWVYRHHRRQPTPAASGVSSHQSATHSQALKQIQQAIDQADYHALRSALIGWGKHHSQNPQLNSLALLSRQFPALADAIGQLNQQLYGKPCEHPQATAAWDPQTLLDAINTLAATNSDKKNPDRLSPLYE